MCNQPLIVVDRPRLGEAGVKDTLDDGPPRVHTLEVHTAKCLRSFEHLFEFE